MFKTPVGGADCSKLQWMGRLNVQNSSGRGRNYKIRSQASFFKQGTSPRPFPSVLTYFKSSKLDSGKAWERTILQPDAISETRVGYKGRAGDCFRNVSETCGVRGTIPMSD